MQKFELGLKVMTVLQKCNEKYATGLILHYNPQEANNNNQCAFIIFEMTFHKVTCLICPYDSHTFFLFDLY